MPWKEVSLMSLRKEFVSLAMGEGYNFSQLCDRFHISRKTGYKWVNRYLGEGESGLSNRSRRPTTSPAKTPEEIEEKVMGIRTKHPAWGGRKIAARLKALGMEEVPAASTITAILKRHGCIDPEQSLKHQPWRRFEADSANDLWQMDFKGHFEVVGGRCHPLTVLDDHSRYALGLQACRNETGATVQQRLSAVFRCFGLPKRILVDNGSPWGSDPEHPYSPLTVWLMRLGIGVVHSRSYHPQTLGKDERFHRSLGAEVLHYCIQTTIEQCQQRFDQWRELYNTERPHEALGMAVPASRYRLSARCFPEILPPIEYGPDDQVRKVQHGGKISYGNKEYRLPKAFRGQRVALRPTACDGVMDVYFCNQIIHQIDLRNPN